MVNDQPNNDHLISRDPVVSLYAAQTAETAAVSIRTYVEAFRKANADPFFDRFQQQMLGLANVLQRHSTAHTKNALKRVIGQTGEKETDWDPAETEAETTRTTEATIGTGTETGTETNSAKEVKETEIGTETGTNTTDNPKHDR